MTTEISILIGFILALVLVGGFFLGKNYLDNRYLFDKSVMQKQIEDCRIEVTATKTYCESKIAAQAEHFNFLMNTIIKSLELKNFKGSTDSKNNDEEKKDIWNDPKKIRESLKNLQENLVVPDDEKFHSLTPNEAFHQLTDRLEELEANK